MKQTAKLMKDAPLHPGVPFPAASVRLSLIRLRLVNFRSYAVAELNVEPGPVILVGGNGTGKTNCLEAISLLSPGRGLRGAKLAELQRKAPHETVARELDEADPLSASLWAVAGTIARADGTWDIGTGLAPAGADVNPRRTMHLNGAPAQGADLAELVPMLWLTPAQDRLFLEAASERRRFLDRLTFALDSAHARRVVRYERAMRQRLRLLRQQRDPDPVWLDALEETMAETGAGITQARLSLVEKLNGELTVRGAAGAARAAGAFPCAHLALADPLGEDAADTQTLRTRFAGARRRDGEAGRTTLGPNAADLAVRHTSKRADARDCSTGEQKALLISIVLANAWLQARKDGAAPPILLLDEIVAHLDAAHRAATEGEIAEMASLVERGLQRGALAVGFGLQYTPGASRWEALEMFRVAAKFGASCHVHIRGMGDGEPMNSYVAVEEVIAASAITGAPGHVVHLNSSGIRAVPHLLQMIGEAQSKGIDVTTECYPYTAALTGIESAIFDEGWQDILGIDHGNLEWTLTGERLTASTFAEFREIGGMVIIHMMPDDAVLMAVASPLTAIASDGWIRDGKGHPRSSGTYTRVLGVYVREKKALSLMEALRKMTLMPAQRLESLTPTMKNKGRVRVGADADLAIFDPARVLDMATYMEPTKQPEGMVHVLVNGVPVVENGQLQVGATPGRAFRAPVN